MPVALDHVAIATRDAHPAIETLTGNLGGLVLLGGYNVGFRSMQVFLGDDAGDGMPIELLEPWQTDQNDFLDRFLVRHGAGPHHLTFKVPDLDAALARVRAAGFTPVSENRDDPNWMEAFLLPKQAQGTVVQLAQTVYRWPTRQAQVAQARNEGPMSHPCWWPEPSTVTEPGVAVLRRVVLVTPDLAEARALFEGLLEGQVERAAGDCVDLVWPSGARLRLEQRAGAAPGIDRLEGDVAGPAREVVLADTRLLLASRG